MEISLDRLKLNKSGYIVDIRTNENIRKRLIDLGLIKNTSIKPVLQSPSGNIRAYEIRGSVLSIRDKDANKIILKLN